MELPILISSAAEYNYAVSRDYQPLQDNNFKLPISLRIDIQRQTFGQSYISKGNVIQANQRFYLWCWENKKHFCEECGAPLQEYSAKFISHILSRGSRADMAHDPRNVNILCYNHHVQWEDNTRNKLMRIYRKNQKTIILLKTDYR